MAKPIIELTASLAANLASQALTPEELAAGIRAIHNTLVELAAAEDVGEQPAHFEHAKDSIGRHEVVCLECGKPFKLLSNRHLGLHGMTPRGYKQKHGIPMTQPLSSRALTERRRKLARDMGMGSQLSKWRDEQRRLKAVGD